MGIWQIIDPTEGTVQIGAGNLADLKVVQHIGTGRPDPELIYEQYAGLDGAFYQGQYTGPRTFSLVMYTVSGNPDKYHQARQNFSDLVDRYRNVDDIAATIRYVKTDSTGTVDIPCYFAGGMGLNEPKGYKEKITATFFANSVWWEDATTTVQNLNVANFGTINYIAERRGGATWDYLADGLNGPAYAVAYDPNTGDLVAGGNFGTAGTVQARNLARYLRASDDWEEFGGGTDGIVRVLHYRDGTIHAGGEFSQVDVDGGGTTVNKIASYDLTGSAWYGYNWTTDGGNSGTGVYQGTVLAINFNSDNEMVIGGDIPDFYGVGGTASWYPSYSYTGTANVHWYEYEGSTISHPGTLNMPILQHSARWDVAEVQWMDPFPNGYNAGTASELHSYSVYDYEAGTSRFQTTWNDIDLDDMETQWDLDPGSEYIYRKYVYEKLNSPTGKVYDIADFPTNMLAFVGDMGTSTNPQADYVGGTLSHQGAIVTKNSLGESGDNIYIDPLYLAREEPSVNSQVIKGVVGDDNDVESALYSSPSVFRDYTGARTLARPSAVDDISWIGLDPSVGTANYGLIKHDDISDTTVGYSTGGVVSKIRYDSDTERLYMIGAYTQIGANSVSKMGYEYDGSFYDESVKLGGTVNDVDFYSSGGTVAYVSDGTASYVVPQPTTVTVAGKLPVNPIIKVVGPGTINYIENTTTGATIPFNNLNIPSGSTLIIDTRVRNKSITLNGTGNYQSYLDDPNHFDTFELYSGQNVITYSGDVTLTSISVEYTNLHRSVDDIY